MRMCRRPTDKPSKLEILKMTVHPDEQRQTLGRPLNNRLTTTSWTTCRIAVGARLALPAEASEISIVPDQNQRSP